MPGHPAAPDPASPIPLARFDLTPATSQHPATLHATGDIDLTNAAQFQAALAEAAAGSPGLTADLTGVTFCDSAAIHALFTTARQTRLTIIVPREGPITTLLKVSALDQLTTVMTA